MVIVEMVIDAFVLGVVIPCVIVVIIYSIKTWE
jgi:hypothetical protein